MTAADTLGHLVLLWLCRHLPSPRDEREPFSPARWQMERTLRWYEVDAAGKRCWNRVHDTDPKGRGKSPMAAAIAIAEFRGPVVFAGWATGGEVYACSEAGCSCGWEYEYCAGEPMGKPWGSPGLPSPWVQVAAVSEAQSANTWAALHAFLAGNERRAAKWLGLDAGRTLVYWVDRVDAKMERVTASASTRTGQPITHAVMDEPQEWVPGLHGPELARTVLENLTKMDGWAHFTGNAPVLGRGSVSELFGYRLVEGRWEPAPPMPRVLHLGTGPSVTPRPDMTREELRPLVREVYQDTPWTPVDRILDDAEDRVAYPWPEVWRLFLNLHLGRDPLNKEGKPMLGTGDRVALEARTWTAAEGEQVDLTEIEAYLTQLRRRLPARVRAQVPVGTRGRMRDGTLRGPEIAYAGAFFAGSAQRFRAESAALVDIPSTPERLTPAAEVLMQLVASGVLLHDGDAELARQLGNVVAKPMPKGWKPEPIDPDEPIVAARAAMLAVHRAYTAPRWKPGSAHAQ